MIKKAIEKELCCFIVANYGEVLGKPIFAKGQDADQPIGIDAPRVMRTVNIQDNDPTPPNAFRLSRSQAIVFLPLITKAGALWNIAPYTPVSEVKDDALKSAYIAATTGLIMAKNVKVEVVK